VTGWAELEAAEEAPATLVATIVVKTRTAAVRTITPVDFARAQDSASLGCLSGRGPEREPPHRDQ
jgi:hypothetical protein